MDIDLEEYFKTLSPEQLRQNNDTFHESYIDILTKRYNNLIYESSYASKTLKSIPEIYLNRLRACTNIEMLHDTYSDIERTYIYTTGKVPDELRIFTHELETALMNPEKPDIDF